MIRHLNQKILASALCAGVFLCLLFSAPSYASNTNQVENVKQEIARQKSQLDKKQHIYNNLQKDLKQHEVQIGVTADKIHKTENQLEQINTSIAKLDNQLQQLKQQQQKQLDVMATLLNAQYRQGQDSDIASLLSGENSAQLDRMTTYAEYLSKARADVINELEATQTELQLNIHQLSQQQDEKKQVLTTLHQQKQLLENQQESRQKTLNDIKSQIRSNNQYLTDLKANEKQMLAAIAKAKAEADARAKAAAAKAAAKKAPMDGLVKHKGKLTWPVKGTILHQYGSSQQGQLRWKGMVISKPLGSQVDAIYSGKVVFADWLRGYGLLLVIDHGKGDMSFYGYNQTLLKKVGDTVQAGEPIALVGDSGGQERPGLYFEIRRKGQPTNPVTWLRRQ